MSDIEEYNIADAISLTGEQSDSDLDSSGFFSDENGVQDEILSMSEDGDDGDERDEDDQERVVKKKKTGAVKAKPQAPASFPSLELSDDEDEKKDGHEMSSYFTVNNTQAKKLKSGTFVSFGFSKLLLANISKKGYKQPTPIQRKTIPLILENRDVVGMARTGSGKTAAFTLPLVERLKTHSPKVGARAIVLSPSRELALQTYKQVKEFSRGTDLRSIVFIGGDSLEDQFSSMMANPDIIIATPGRFMHLKVEMLLDLLTVEYVVFDEADRLFEMGFEEQLTELISALPPSRQTLLFSATLPKTLVGFAKAGLTNPVLVRLDTESKISEHLEMAFFSTKKNEREANLLFTLQEVIKMPLALPEEIKKLEKLGQVSEDEDDNDEDNDDSKTGRKRKRPKFKKERLPPANVLPSPHSTIVFVPTKHHVEYISNLLVDAGYLVSFIYGTLDQVARKQQLYQFRSGLTTILVVTDVAARGIDIPVLANVINYTLPGSSKIFIHRVGRTARAGNKGWAYSLLNEKELPYLLDLELFLGKKVLLTGMHEKKCEVLKEKMGANYTEPKISYTDRLVLGTAPRLQLDQYQEFYDTLLQSHYELGVIKSVALKGEKLYHRTRQAASQESLKRAKEIMETDSWEEQHLLFGPNLEKEKEKFLAKLAIRNNKETVFEYSKKSYGKEENSLVDFMAKRRRQIAPIQRRAKERRELLDKERLAGLSHGIEDEILNAEGEIGYSNTQVAADESELQETFEDADEVSEKKRKTFKDPQFFISHYAPAADVQDKQLSLSSSFANDASKAAFDLDNDDKLQVNKQIMKWDKKKGKYINSQSTDKKFIISESGQRIPATFKSGRYDEWRKQRNLLHAPVGSLETPGNDTNKKFKHKKVSAPKMPDKYRDDYHKQKKKVEKAVESGINVKGFNKSGQKQELKSTSDIRKARELKDKRRAKNARPSKKRK